MEIEGVLHGSGILNEDVFWSSSSIFGKEEGTPCGTSSGSDLKQKRRQKGSFFASELLCMSSTENGR